VFYLHTLNLDITFSFTVAITIFLICHVDLARLCTPVIYKNLYIKQLNLEQNKNNLTQNFILLRALVKRQSGDNWVKCFDPIVFQPFAVLLFVGGNCLPRQVPLRQIDALKQLTQKNNWCIKNNWGKKTDDAKKQLTQKNNWRTLTIDAL
jgi:hypothetical protein